MPPLETVLDDIGSLIGLLALIHYLASPLARYSSVLNIQSNNDNNSNGGTARSSPPEGSASHKAYPVGKDNVCKVIDKYSRDRGNVMQYGSRNGEIP